MALKTSLTIQILVSILWHPLIYLLDEAIDDYDHSQAGKPELHYIKHAIRYDSDFYIDIGLNGYRYFKNHAFFPGYPMVIRISSYISNHPLYVTLLFNEVFNVMSSIFLYKTTLIVYKKEKVKFIDYLSSLH